MTDDRARRLAQLRQAYESGILDEDTYRAAVAALSTEARIQATVEGSGAVAQDGGVAAGADGLIVEVHPHPHKAFSDGPQSLKPERFATLMAQIRAICTALERPIPDSPTPILSQGARH